MGSRQHIEHQANRKNVTQRALRAAYSCALAGACCLHMGIVSASEPAANFPSKPVRLIVAQGTGSSVDNLGRILGLRLTEE